MYAEALAAGMDAGTFWRSSPRAVLLVIRAARRRMDSLRRFAPPPSKREAFGEKPRRVRLNRLPRP